MMNEEHRVSATKIIWIVFLLALIVTNANIVFFGQTPLIENVIMTMIAAIAATGSSVAVWTRQNPFSSDESSSDAKLKRGQRVERLIDLMDDDELYELRQRLSKDYAEPPMDYVMLGDDGELSHGKIKH